HLLAHASRVRRHRVVAPFPETHEAQEVLDLALALSRRDTVEAGVEVEVVPRRQALVEPGLLREDPHDRTDARVVAAEPKAGDLRRAGRRRDEGAQQPDR